MPSTYTYPRYAYRRPAELDSPGATPRHPVVVVGAGPVGLATAIDLAQQGLAVVLLDDDDTVSVGSRGLCYAKRTLEVLDRLGCGEAVAAKGVTWNIGRTFFGNEEVFRFNLQPEPDHHRPGMVNLQQYHLEEFMVRRAAALPFIDLRWKHRVVAVAPQDDGVRVEVQTADGRYALQADWLVVADGARSPVRTMLGLEVEGKVFRDRFLIVDVVLKQPMFAGNSAERWFWFEPPFHPGAGAQAGTGAPASSSVLLHREADNVWRIDFQLGWGADPELEARPERVIPRLHAMLGPDAEFDLEWVSVYTFQCRRLQRLRHGRVLFAGDAAHQVSPFGARGANSGVQDADNLGWKLALVLQGHASEALLDSYSDERIAAADENILESTRSTDFITPRSQVAKDFRDAVLTLAREHPFARLLVNSGRLSVPAQLGRSPLNTPDRAVFECRMAPGSAMEDAPLRHQGQDGWLLQHAGGRFVMMLFAPTTALDAAAQAAIRALAGAPLAVHTLLIVSRDAAGEPPAGCTVLLDHRQLVARRYGARPGSVYLLRPDQHVAARWHHLSLPEVNAALARATAQV
ncbi:2-polyprenyl-6-methoxyphenol hydroxylase and related FAD-dependent oxidoreductases [Rubrivivax sp. A210]|uniref:FAD-dependent oxidoreductase n=1 Tax=Rubrivivax sp. A210 TaxID=2772301 RepID=UPI001919A6DE|nr:FAD-dependent oxidoreductase [Rubrivivax sp. A210]CAD5375184.1 2-polyprenyl-6-methoxyphenol hydroxylase and related FAD-dependent oxidoreductases [Rubrivivax sp. A210]